MKRIAMHKTRFLVIFLLGMLALSRGSISASQTASGDLAALERLAIQAKSLMDQIERLKKQLEAAEQRQLETKTKIDALTRREQEKDQQILALEAQLAEAKETIKKNNNLLDLFRSGAFEYYEVQEGDTLETIAANPMVYGDKTKAKWIALVNDMKTNALPAPGSVIIIPRYTEGTSYEF